MNDFEEIKNELKHVDKAVELSQSWLIQGIQGFLLSRIPGLDSAIGAAVSQQLSKEQNKKIQKLCDTIFNDTTINLDKVKDIDIVMEMVRTVDVVLKLSQNEKIIYIGTLFRECFLRDERQFDEFAEWLHRLETLSLREIKMLAGLYQYEKGETGPHHEEWYKFKVDIANEYGISENMVVDIFSGMVSSGFCRQSNEIFPGAADIENPFYTTEYFKAFLHKII